MTSQKNEPWQPARLLITTSEVDNAISDAIATGKYLIASPLNAAFVTTNAILIMIGDDENT